jgi:hypothetical protein
MPKESSQQRAERLKLVDAYRESGQSFAEFGRERGITSWQIRHAVHKTEASATGSKAFQEIAVTGPAGTDEYRVTLKNGRELNLPAHFSEKRVRQLIEILESC